MPFNLHTSSKFVTQLLQAVMCPERTSATHLRSHRPLIAHQVSDTHTLSLTHTVGSQCRVRL